MKLSVFLMFAMCFTAMANESAMSQTVNVDFQNAKLNEVFRNLREQTGKVIVFSDTKLDSGNNKVTLKMNDVPLSEALELILENLPYSYSIIDDVVYIIPSSSKAQQTPQTVIIRGKVTDSAGNPLAGVTVVAKGTTRGAATNAQGMYEFALPRTSDISLVFSFVGMGTQEVAYTGQREINVTLVEKVQTLEDVVVTGYFDRTRQSITGSEVSVRGEELRRIGSMNLLTAISVFDPSVRTIQNNEYGSDPNRVPEISIRGESGFALRETADDSRSNPNSPLYILDGIEVSATTVYDLDLNRVEAFAILKDAAATALYGSRGANGVILITSVRPRSGELRVTLNTNFYVSIPDLRDYNLMNAAEKLEYERRAGVYESYDKEKQLQLDINYNNLLAEVARGVDTYWISKPLRTSINQRYNVFVEGGDQHIRYGVDLKYDSDKGVMKGSDRERYGIKVNLNYIVSDKIRLYNDLSVDDVKGSNSPYGNFSQYAAMNPYERIYDPETGEMIRAYDTNGNFMVNPLFDGTLPNTDQSRYTEIKDNFSFEWRIDSHLHIKGLAALTKNIGKDERYRSPESSDFYNETDINKRGSYTVRNSNSMNFDGNLRVMYNNVFAEKITVSANAGAEISTYKYTDEGFTAIGFINDKRTNPAFAQGLKDDSQTGKFDKTRLAAFLANLNLGYDNRFFIDATFRTDGSSKFGRNSRFAPFWSVGGAWNVDRESWWAGDGHMKVRASLGSTGTTNFNSDQAITRYTYSGDSEYNGVNGAILDEYGNPNLKWQNTLQYNAGLDMNVLGNIIVFNIDFYLKRTQNLLLAIDIAPSTGFTSYRENLGSIDNRGFDGRLRFNILRDSSRDLFWSVTLAVEHNKNEIRKLSTAMKKMNEEALKLANSGYDPNNPETGTQVYRLYEEGRSQSALMVVKSYGIDPMTGQEIFVNLDGTTTFEYDPSQKIMVGDTNPKYQGHLQTNLTWKGFNLFASFNYEYGAKIFNTTLAQKVEGAIPSKNADRRVLYDRWYQPGDRTLYRDIRSQKTVYQTTRLVQDNDFIRLSNLSLTYEFPHSILDRWFIERCRITLSSSDLFRISTVKQERGTRYPFARSFSAGLSVTF